MREFIAWAGYDESAKTLYTQLVKQGFAKRFVCTQPYNMKVTEEYCNSLLGDRYIWIRTSSNDIRTKKYVAFIVVDKELDYYIQIKVFNKE